MQVSPCRAPNAGLLTGGAMSAYSAMLLWGALSDEPPDDICSMHNSTGSNGLRVRSPQLIALRLSSLCPAMLLSCIVFENFLHACLWGPEQSNPGKQWIVIDFITELSMQ